MLKRLPLLIAVLALALWAGNFIIRDFLAASLITYGQGVESRDAAVNYAPANAEALAARARYLLMRSEEPRNDDAIADLMRAVAASPNDYRYWLELGKARGGNDQFQQAEDSLQRAIELAPRYFEPRWALANLRLRTGKLDQAQADFRQAITLSGSLYGNASPRPDRNATLNAYNAMTGAMGVNLDALRSVTPQDSAAQAYLAEFFATHDAIDQALEIWRRLPAAGIDAEPNSYRELSFQLLRELQAKNRFGEARDVWRKFAESESSATNGQDNLITNGGFEQTPLSEKYPTLIDPPSGFDWIIRRHPEVRAIRSNDVSHSGSYSIHLTFAASMNSEFQDIFQFVAVEPMLQYRLTYFLKTKNVSSLANEAPFIEITDAANPSSFNLRSIAPSGTSDWREQAITFTTTESTRGLRLTIRSPQLKVDRTRVTEIRLDDFKLEGIETGVSNSPNK